MYEDKKYYQKRGFAELCLGIFIVLLFGGRIFLPDDLNLLKKAQQHEQSHTTQPEAIKNLISMLGK